MGLDTSARNRNRTSRALVELGKQNAALAEVLATVPQTPAPALPVPIELYEFTLDYTQVVALGAMTTGSVNLGNLPAGCFVLTLTSTVTVPFVGAAGYNLELNVALRATGFDTSWGDTDPYDETGKLYHVIGSDTYSPYPDDAEADHGTTKSAEVSAFAFTQLVLPARRYYVPTVRVNLNDTGGGGNLENYTAGSVTLRYIVLRAFGL